MNKCFKYKYDQKNGIIYKDLIGKITVSDILHSWEYAFDNKLIPHGINKFLVDIRSATLIYKNSEHTQISDFFKANLNFFGGSRIAIVTRHTSHLALPILVNRYEGYSVKPFSRIKSAREWVMM